MCVYVIVLQQSFIFIHFVSQRLCVTWPFYMYILNKSFISKVYSAVEDQTGDNFSDALALLLCWKIRQPPAYQDVYKFSFFPRTIRKKKG